MIYNPKDPQSRKDAAIRFSDCLSGEDCFEIVIKGRRSLRQNSYLHLCLGYLAARLGLRLEYVKEEYYKKLVNPDIYCYKFWDKIKKEVVTETKSSKSLTKEEMSTSIERLKVWSAQEAEIVLPDAEDWKAIQWMQMEVEKNKQYI